MVATGAKTPPAYPGGQSGGTITSSGEKAEKKKWSFKSLDPHMEQAKKRSMKHFQYANKQMCAPRDASYA